ncbi:MAG: MFS transporter [Phycisphaeraceae bacterium]|nr:MFS transporter [Phycisphaeraceae bacterium]
MKTVQPSLLPPFYVGQETADVTQRISGSLVAAGVLSIAFAAYCIIALPRTEPKRQAMEKLAFAKAFTLMRRPSLMLLVLASLMISAIHTIYFIQTPSFFSAIGVRDAMILPAMSIGPFAEVAVMAVLGGMLRRWGFKRVIVLGALAYFLRYLAFGTAALPVWMVIASQALHGLCYGCFFAATFIYVEKLAPADVRHSAQTMYGIIVLGIGPVLGGWFNGMLAGLCMTGERLSFGPFWHILAGVGLGVAILVDMAFVDETQAGAG